MHNVSEKFIVFYLEHSLGQIITISLVIFLTFVVRYSAFEAGHLDFFFCDAKVSTNTRTKKLKRSN